MFWPDIAKGSLMPAKCLIFMRLITVMCRYTGTTVPLPNRFVSQSNQITVCFTSDSTITQRGYSAVYSKIYYQVEFYLHSLIIEI